MYYTKCSVTFLNHTPIGFYRIYPNIYIGSYCFILRVGQLLIGGSGLMQLHLISIAN